MIQSADLEKGAKKGRPTRSPSVQEYRLQELNTIPPTEMQLKSLRMVNESRGLSRELELISIDGFVPFSRVFDPWDSGFKEAGDVRQERGRERL
jgi:hypothetical protein